MMSENKYTTVFQLTIEHDKMSASKLDELTNSIKDSIESDIQDRNLLPADDAYQSVNSLNLELCSTDEVYR